MIPVDGNYTSIKEAAENLARSISYALSPEVRACALEVAEKLSLEVMLFLENYKKHTNSFSYLPIKGEWVLFILL